MEKYILGLIFTIFVSNNIGTFFFFFLVSIILDTEFRLVINSGSDTSCHSSPAMTGCSPLLSDLSGTLSRLPKNKGRVIVLRAPKTELKAVWQNLIQRQM